jgi:hypothetical protein
VSSNMAPGRPPSAPQTGWKVIGQVQVTEADPQGRAARGVRVSFTTNLGVSGSVFVAEDRYHPDNVRAAVAAAAAAMDQVQQLSG